MKPVQDPILEAMEDFYNQEENQNIKTKICLICNENMNDGD